MQCPDCGANQFYAKDPGDQYTISEFRLEAGTIEYVDELDAAARIPISEDTEIFCDRCAWHDKFRCLKQAG